MKGLEHADLEAAAELLRSLGHTVRLALLRALIDGERSVGEIEQATGVAQPSLSQQLAVLRKAELVKTRKKAKLVFYRINHARMAELLGTLEAFARISKAPNDRATVDRMRIGGGAAMFARVRPRV